MQAGEKIFRKVSMGGFHKEIGEMSQVQGSNAFWHRSLFLECIDSFLMQTGFEKILKFRKDLIHIGSQLYFYTGTLFDGLLAEPAKFLQLNIIQILQGRKTGGVLQWRGDLRRKTLTGETG